MRWTYENCLHGTIRCFRRKNCYIKRLLYVFAGHEFVYYDKKVAYQDTLLERVKDAEILILANQPLSAEIINACDKLKMIDIAFTGVDHVAMDAARARNLVVCNAAGYSTNAVAELTFGLAISAIRNIPACNTRCHIGSTKDGLVGFNYLVKLLVL